MKGLIAFFGAIVLLTMLSLSVWADTYVAGQVMGTWTTAGSPYMVLADIEIPYGQTLTIDPGVQVKFTGHFKFIAHGTLTAVGAVGDSILMTHHLPYETYTWAGLYLDVTSGTSEIAYCNIEWGYAQGVVGQAGAKGGAIHVNSTNVLIHNNRIHHNKADVKGAGIYLNMAAGEIYDNIINYNTSYGDGGGIMAESTSAPYIHNNTIEYNTADNGGGVMYTYSGGVIEYNVINHNSATSTNGGGLLMDHSSPAIQYNVINTNTSSSNSGTGIYCHHYSSPLILYNEICNNNYTAIYCGDHASPEIDNNTIYGNGNYALRTYSYSSPFGRNNIIVGNSYGFYVSSGCSIYMTYSNIQGGWSGTGNIDAQPYFVDPYAANFNLMPNSPCIDAGSPIAPLDPDGTISDQGAHYFDQNQPQGTCALTLTPFGAPIILPPSGGTVWFGVSVINSPSYFNLFDGWYNLQQPDGQILPMMLRTNLYLPPGGQMIRTLSLTLNASAMPGIYTVTGYVGNNPAIIEDFDSFTFEKSATGKDGGAGGMVTITDGDLTETYQLASSLPEQTQLLGHYPEPCNPQATISFALAQTEQVHLEVYSLTGQRVATLVDGELNAGIYRETFEGNNLASGIYLYVLQAGDYRTSGKLTLMK